MELSWAKPRGLALFNDLKKGNCASCHPSTHKSPTNLLPIFTDFGYVALAVAQNPTCLSTATGHSLISACVGRCAPIFEITRSIAACSASPTLRNVALRKNDFHNGAMHSLRDVVEFYATRDVAPQKWYARAAGKQVEQYDDLPATHWANVDVDVPPERHADGRSRLSPSEVNDVVAFLGTLSDGYSGPARQRSSR